MSGGILQLVSYGSADIVLTGNPQITYWKQIHKRYTNFAIESVIQTPHATVDFGRRTSITLSRTADLVHKMYLEVTLPRLPSIETEDTQVTYDYKWVKKIGLALIKSVELEISGQRIDRHTSDWMDAWYSLTENDEKSFGLRQMIGDFDNEEDYRTNREITLHIPLIFFFNLYHGLSLPLISISFHEVKLNFEFRSLKELVRLPNEVPSSTPLPVESSSTALKCDFYGDMIYVDVDERRRFSRMAHEMLIPVVQWLGDEVINNMESPQFVRKINLNYVHPVKELVWMYLPDAQEEAKDYFNYDDVFEEVGIYLNGHPRFKDRKGSYFRLVQPWQHHSNVPKSNIYCYSFALHPEDAQPSGSLNFSRIDQAYMQIRLKNTAIKGTLKIFAISYNLLRIKNGLAGLAYSN